MAQTWAGEDAKQADRRRICFVVNPLAGIGGPTGYKGSDGVGERLLAAGAPLVAPSRARRFALHLSELPEAKRAMLLTASGLMGEEYLRGTGISYEVVYRVEHWPTRAQDTRAAVRECINRGAELIVFVGGDGTARDVAAEAGDTPILGVPGGVKMYSSVFAETPEAAAEAAASFIRGESAICEGELLDIDEEAFRNDRLDVRLHGTARTLCTRGMVGSTKQPSPDTLGEEENREAIARYIAENMEECTLYVLGPGTTVKAVEKLLGIKGSILGVDVIHNKRLVARDVDEKTLYQIVSSHVERGGRVKIVVTPIGGQGFVLGRGNQQISPRVLRAAGGRRSLVIVATRTKLLKTPRLRLDTGDPCLDRELAGYIRVVTDYNEETVTKLHAYRDTGETCNPGDNGGNGKVAPP